jgi:hypothetical protein
MPQFVPPTQTFRPQQLLITHTCPTSQSVCDWQSASAPQSVVPSAQNPDPEVVDVQMQFPPGPHVSNVSQVFPAHSGAGHAPFWHSPEVHWSDISFKVIFSTMGSCWDTYLVPTGATVILIGLEIGAAAIT